MTRSVTGRRSVAKAITYRVVIMSLDFITIYLFTGTVRVALGFMIASNSEISTHDFTANRRGVRF